MPSPRNSYRSREITLDLVYKVRNVVELAKRHNISHQRVYQLVNAQLYSMGMNLSMAQADPLKVRDRLRPPRYIGHVVAATPEEFYFELMGEPKTFNL